MFIRGLKSQRSRFFCRSIARYVIPAIRTDFAIEQLAGFPSFSFVAATNMERERFVPRSLSSAITSGIVLHRRQFQAPNRERFRRRIMITDGSGFAMYGRSAFPRRVPPPPPTPQLRTLLILPRYITILAKVAVARLLNSTYTRVITSRDGYTVATSFTISR